MPSSEEPSEAKPEACPADAPVPDDGEGRLAEVTCAPSTQEADSSSSRGKSRWSVKHALGVVGMLVLTAGIGWNVTRGCDCIMPEGPQEIAWPESMPASKRTADDKSVYWSLDWRQATPAEMKVIKRLHRAAPEAVVFGLFVRTDCAVSLSDLTIFGSFDKPILAHLIPGLWKPTSYDEHPITDRLRHFAYERSFLVRYHEVPSHTEIMTYFMVPPCKFEVYCSVEGECAAAEPWPSDVAIPENIFEGGFGEARTDRK